MTLHHDLHWEQHPGPEQAPHLVLLHGWGLHSGVWKDFLPLLGEHFRVTCIDLPGFGKSSEMALTDFADAAAALVSEKAIWLGWSLGGALALEIAARHPEKVEALCMLAATPCFVQRKDWQTAVPRLVFADFADALREDPWITLEGFLTLQCKGSVSMKADLRFLRGVLASSKLPSAAALYSGLQYLLTVDLRERLRLLKQPVLLLLGEKDALVPAALEKSIAVVNPAVRTALVLKAAHLPFVSHPQVCRDVLLHFCRGIGVRA